MSADRLDDLDYYTLLGIERSAQVDAIRHAFHRFALKYHPDNFAAAAPPQKRRASQIFRRGAEAYRILLDPGKRSVYDAGLAEGLLRFRPGAEAGASSKRRGARRVGPKARPFFAKAERALKAGDMQSAELNLKIALQHEPESAVIQEKLAAVAEAMAKK